MGKFLESEKPKQIYFKENSVTVSKKAKEDGYYKSHPYPFCLPQEHAEENLFPEIREQILDYFARHKIKWHDGHNGKPSNHLCDSQVCCANFLFPFADKPNALANLLRPIYPTIDRMLLIEDGYYVSFEWIGEMNYLKEAKPGNQARTRGANFTSADAAVMFQRADGQKQIVLIEWKYTESYRPVSLETAPSGRKRTEIYRHLFDSIDCPLDKKDFPGFEALFYEPFYQLMRQQLLANEMEKAHELGADTVSLLHISPAHNIDFKRVTSKALQPFGNSPTEIWAKLLKVTGKFNAIDSEALFQGFDFKQFPELAEWHGYIRSRYSWVLDSKLDG